MFVKFIKMQHIINRLNKLKKYHDLLNKFSDYLTTLHYSYASIRHYRCAIEHFLLWNRKKNLKINRKTVDIFLEKHIPMCKCSIPAPKKISDLRPALRLILKINQSERLDNDKITEIDKLINEFDNHLLSVCGLCDNTRKYHRRHVKIFLNYFFKNAHIHLKKLNPTNIRNFIYQNLTHYKRRTLGVFVYSLRSFFRFLQFKGLIKPQLILALPNIIEYKASALPEYLSKKEIKKLIGVLDRGSRLGKRDYAIITSILEIGLRACEVAHLTLDDINWDDQTFSIARGKTHQSYILPMTIKMRNAIITYLKYGRPKTTSREVFVYHRSPVGKAIIPKVVSELVRRALIRAGIKPLIAGSHLLRKTFATKMLQSGATIKEIADLLRHRSIATTSIYAKVDFSKLIQVALPWPQEIR